MVVGVTIGVLIILFGMILCTDRIDQHWKNRQNMTLPQKQPTPPFRYSTTQCVDCGKDGDLLSIDTGQCFYCFGLVHHAGGGATHG